MCADPAWTASRTPPAWIATNSALLVAAGLGPPAEHALISLLALNGLRVSEATGANIQALGIERGHRTLVITRKGGKVVPHTLRHVHHRRPRRRGTTARRAGSRLARRSSHHNDDRARASLDRHTTYIVAAYIAGAAR